MGNLFVWFFLEILVLLSHKHFLELITPSTWTGFDNGLGKEARFGSRPPIVTSAYLSDRSRRQGAPGSVGLEVDN